MSDADELEQRLETLFAMVEDTLQELRQATRDGHEQTQANQDAVTAARAIVPTLRDTVSEATEQSVRWSVHALLQSLSDDLGRSVKAATQEVARELEAAGHEVGDAGSKLRAVSNQMKEEAHHLMAVAQDMRQSWWHGGLASAGALALAVMLASAVTIWKVTPGLDRLYEEQSAARAQNEELRKVTLGWEERLKKDQLLTCRPDQAKRQVRLCYRVDPAFKKIEHKGGTYMVLWRE